MQKALILQLRNLAQLFINNFKLENKTMRHHYTYSPSPEALEKRRAAAMDMLAVLAYSIGLTLLLLAWFDIITF